MPGHSGQDGDGTGPARPGRRSIRLRGRDEPAAPGPAAAPARPDQDQGQQGRPEQPRRPAGLAGTVNFTIPLTTWLRLAGGPGEATGSAPRRRRQPRPHHRRRHHPRLPLVPDHHQPQRPRHRARLRQEKTTTSRTRATRPPRSHPRPDRRPRPRATRRSPGRGRLRWLTGLTMSWLETGTCGHARETSAYQPPPALRHLLQTRAAPAPTPAAAAPPPAATTTTPAPYDQGGRTCECNLAPYAAATTGQASTRLAPRTTPPQHPHLDPPQRAHLHHNTRPLPGPTEGPRPYRAFTRH